MNIYRRSARAYGQGFSREEREKRAEGEKPQPRAEDPLLGVANAARDSTSPTLPTRAEVLSACLSTSAVLGVVGVGVYFAAPIISPAKGTEAFEALHAGSLVGDISIKSIVATLATAGAVTGRAATTSKRVGRLSCSNRHCQQPSAPAPRRERRRYRPRRERARPCGRIPFPLCTPAGDIPRLAGCHHIRAGVWCAARQWGP